MLIARFSVTEQGDQAPIDLPKLLEAYTSGTYTHLKNYLWGSGDFVSVLLDPYNPYGDPSRFPLSYLQNYPDTPGRKGPALAISATPETQNPKSLTP